MWVDGYIVSPLGIRCCDKQRRPHAASPTPHLTQAAPCSVPASACQRAADAATVALEAEAAVAEAAGAAAAAAAAMAHEAEHAGGWWGHWHAYAGCSPAKSTSLAQPMGTQRGQSPLRGLSPRPYAYEAHALPAELRRLLVWPDGYIVLPLGTCCCDKQRRPQAANPAPHLPQAAACSVPASCSASYGERPGLHAKLKGAATASSQNPECAT